MAIHDKYFTGSTVSRFLPPGEHSWDEAVYQSGKPVLDAELNLSQDLGKELRKLVQDRETPSGWLRGPSPVADFDYSFGFPSSTDPDFVADTFWMRKRTALVANMPLTVEYTNTTQKGVNLIQLSTAPVNGGASPDVKRTDFVFLEAFRALVSPSPHASGTLLVLTFPTTGDFNIAGVALTAAGGPRGVGVGANNYDNTLGSEALIAADIRDALNDTSNGFAVSVTAVLDISVPEQVNIRATDALAGAAGNALSLTTTMPAEFTLSGPGSLTGGVDMPNKPTQSTIYRNGNVDAPAGVNLVDEIADPTIGTESTKRVQMQYRVRATGQAENVNFKTENGFSNPEVEAQGTMAIPVDGYRFIPADGVTVLAYVDITGALGAGDTVVVNGITLTAINGGVPAADEFDIASGVPATMATNLTTAITASVATAAASSADGTVTIIPATAGDNITLSSTAPANLTTAVNSAVSYDTVDNGLWIAGDGTLAASNDLGTVDGYVYGISIGFVFRRNDASGTGGFDPEANTNGALAHNHAGYANLHGIGAIPAATSDRPDRNFYDAIAKGDFLDLRRQVSPGGVDLKAELESQMTALLDGNFRTWAVDTQGLMELGGGSGDVSPVYLVCNYVGGDGTSTRGSGIGVWDHIRRRFADQPVVEKRVFPILPTASAANNPGLFMTAPAAGWQVGDQINIDLDSLDAAGLGDWAPSASPDFVSNLWPTGTTITNVLRVVHDDGHYADPISQETVLDQITGLGTPHVILTLGANSADANGGVDGAADYPLVPNGASPASARRIFVELEITYPAGSAATPALRPAMATPDETLIADPAVTAYYGSALIDDPGTLAGSDWDNMVDPAYREGKREIGFEYVSNEIGSGVASNTPITTQVVSGTDLTMVLSRRMWGQKGASTITVTEQGSGAPTPRDVNIVETTWGNSERKLVLQGATPLSAQQSLCDVNYFAQDPIPNLGAIGARLQISAYYRTNAPQTVGVQAGSPASIPLPDPFLVEPVVMSRFLWTGTTSTGSVDLPFPYNNPSDQIAVNADLTTGANPPFPGEWALMSLAKISVGDFDAETGLLNLHQMVPVDPNSDLTFSDLDMDNEFRAAYKVADVNSYRPTAMAQPLSGVATHKVWMPFLAQSSVDTVYFRKGEVLLVVVSRYALLDGDNVVRFVDGSDEACAAIYRTRGLLLLASE